MYNVVQHFFPGFLNPPHYCWCWFTFYFPTWCQSSIVFIQPSIIMLMDTIFEWLVNGHWPISLPGINTTSWFLSLILLLILSETWTWNVSMHVPTSLSLSLMSSMKFFFFCAWSITYLQKFLLAIVTYSSSFTCSMTLTLLAFHNRWFWLSHVIFSFWNFQLCGMLKKFCFICFIDLK